MVARRLIAGRLSLNVEYDLRQSLYTHLQGMSFGFYDKHQTGQLLSRATSDVSAVRMFLGYGLVFITQYGASLVAASVLLLITSWQLALITFVLLPPIAIVATRYSRRSHPVLRDVQQRIADVTTQAEESIVGVRVVKAFAQEDAEGARFAERTERVFERELDSARIQARYSPLLDLLPQLAFAVIILAGGLLVIDGKLSLGGFISYNLYLALLIWPLRMIGMWIGQYQRAVASGERIFQVLDETSDITDPPASARAAGRRRRAALRGRHVRLRRRPARAARSRPRGRARHHDRRDRPHGLGQDHAHVADPALLRPAGGPRRARRRRRARPAARRSARQHRDRRARTRSCSRRPWRRTSPTAAPGATREDVVEAARRAQAHEFIEALPKGYDTISRRARADALGRAAAAALDRTRAARRPARADPRRRHGVGRRHHRGAHPARRCETVMEGRTTIIVAHRLSTIALADEIVVLEDGRVAARGRHDDLVDTNAVYAEIWRHGLVDRTFVSLDEDAPAEAIS